jgi:penicillin-binding protein 1A
MGYDNFEPLGKKDVTGGSTVVPWWIDIMQSILKDYPVRDFGAPPESVQFQKICPWSGKLAKGNCPKARLEIFLKDTIPQEFCDLAAHEEIRPLKKENIEAMEEVETVEERNDN